MAGCTISAQIAAPVAKVFQLASDAPNWAGRIKGITKVEMLTDGPVGVGTRFRETRRMFGKNATEEMEFTAFEPNRGYTLGCQSCGCQYASTFRFEEADGGTRVTMDFDAKPLLFFAKLMSPLGWLMMGSMKKCIQRDLDDLKALAEQGHTPRS